LAFDYHGSTQSDFEPNSYLAVSGNQVFAGGLYPTGWGTLFVSQLTQVTTNALIPEAVANKVQLVTALPNGLVSFVGTGSNPTIWYVYASY